MTLLGGTFVFDVDSVVALAGAEFETTLPQWTACPIRAGETLKIGPTRSGARCYLCVRGGISVPLFLGSASTHVLSGLGGLEGRALRKGDVLQIGEVLGTQRTGCPTGTAEPQLEPSATGGSLADQGVRPTVERKSARLAGDQRLANHVRQASWPAGMGQGPRTVMRATELDPADHLVALGAGAFRSLLTKLAPRKVLRVTTGSQWDWFQNPEALLAAPYRVTEESNRMGLRLEGARLESSGRGQMITEGVPLGAIQIPAGGQPIILFIEQQTTGGYPKIANIISADLPSVGQLRPRDELRFELVSLTEARRLICEQEEELRHIIAGNE
jgi:antagonist of KipI